MYIEVLMALNALLATVLIRVACSIFFVPLRKVETTFVFLLASLLIWYPVLTICILLTGFIWRFRKRADQAIKIISLLVVLVFTSGGMIQLFQLSKWGVVVFLVISLVMVRLGRSIFLLKHAHQHLYEVTCGELVLNGYWDTGNFCSEPLSSLPVHFIQQDILESYPHLFHKTSRQAAITTVSSEKQLPLYRAEQPVRYKGKTLPLGLFAPLEAVELPFQSHILFHHITFSKGGVS